MLRAACWNCGARLSGPQCHMCGAVQNSPEDQPGTQQTSRPIRSHAPGAGAYAPNREQRYVPGGQPGEWYKHLEPEEEYALGTPDQQLDIAKQYGMRGLALSPGAPAYVPGGKPPSLFPEMLNPEPVEPAPSVASRLWEVLSVPLATLGGLVAAVISAGGWAVLLDTTGLDGGGINVIYFFFVLGIAFALGIIVGLGVALGARGHHDIGLSLFAGALGILTCCLALYFRLSLLEGHLRHETANFLALSLEGFSNLVGGYLVSSPLNFINFVMIPLAAIGTAYRYINRGRDGRYDPTKDR